MSLQLQGGGGEALLVVTVHCRGRFEERKGSSSALQAPSLAGRFLLYFILIFNYLFLTRCVRLPRDYSRLYISLENSVMDDAASLLLMATREHASGSGPSSPCRSIS